MIFLCYKTLRGWEKLVMFLCQKTLLRVKNNKLQYGPGLCVFRFCESPFLQATGITKVARLEAVINIRKTVFFFH